MTYRIFLSILLVCSWHRGGAKDCLSVHPALVHKVMESSRRCSTLMLLVYHLQQSGGGQAASHPVWILGCMLRDLQSSEGRSNFSFLGPLLIIVKHGLILGLIEGSISSQTQQQVGLCFIRLGMVSRHQEAAALWDWAISPISKYRVK